MNSKTKQMALLGLMSAVLVLFAFTPIGSIPIGPLVISLQVIPVAICAIALGVRGGFIAGTLFGILSCLQAFGIGIPSGMGMALVAINPILAIIQRLIPRMLCGALAGFIYEAVSKKNRQLAYLLTGLATAFFNTLFFMSALVLLFGNTEYMQGFIQGRSFIPFVIGFVGINAITEMASATFISSAVANALKKSGLI